MLKIINFKNDTIIILYVVAVSLLSRFLFINTNVFFIDGDEAIVGLMGIDIIEGKMPFYFYGQKYGLAFFEAALISLGILIFGTSALAIKIPMLLLWLSAVIFIALSFSSLLKHNKWLVFLFITVLILSPTWLVWSLKARGGYLTSFFFTSLIIFLLIKNKNNTKLYLWLITGALLVVIYESQPLWVPGLIPIIVFFLSTQKDSRRNIVKSLIALTLSAITAFCILTYLKSDIYVAWHTPKPNFADRLGQMDQLPETLLDNLGGNYFLKTTYDPNNHDFSKWFLIVCLAFSFWTIYDFIVKRKRDYSFIFLISTVFSLTGFFVKSHPRYLLPFFGFALMMMVSSFAKMKNRNVKRSLIISLIVTVIIGIYTVTNFKNYSFVNMSITKIDSRIKSDEKIMKKLIHILHNQNIKYVYSTNEFLQYQINYMTKNEILTIGRKDRCRIPENIEKVMKAYEENNKQFAIIGYNFHQKYSRKVPLVDNKIFYVLNPDRSTLEKVGFFSE